MCGWFGLLFGGFDEVQGYVVVFVDGLIFCIVGGFMVVGWGQCLYFVGMVFGVVWVGIDFVVVGQCEVGGFGYCDYLFLFDVVVFVIGWYIGCGVVFNYVQYVIGFEYVVEVFEYVFGLVCIVLVVYIVEGEYYIG